MIPTYSELLGDKIFQKKEGRKCKFKGCVTTLSVYNRDKYCYRHSAIMEMRRNDETAKTASEKRLRRN